MKTIKAIKSAYLYPRHIKSTGALFGTSKAVENEITRFVSSDEGVVVVEFGMGLGNITKEILNRMSTNSKLLAFELNSKFCDHVRDEIDDPRLKIINDSAENARKYLDVQVVNVVSSLPLTLMGETDVLFSFLVLLMFVGSYFSQVLLRKNGIEKFQHYFGEHHHVRVGIMPKYHIYHCIKETPTINS